MGANTSKSTPAPSHVWQSETPVRFSQELVDSLQASTETDSSRAKTLELHIQTRVAEELKRLQAREESVLKDLEAKLSSEETSQSTEKQSAGDTLRSLSRESVQKEVEGLRKKLEARRKVVEIGELDKDVDQAREDVVKCLRGNDRRPLDCWKEVEAFRDGVRKLEESWVDRVVR